MKLPVSVEVSKEAYELGQGVAKFLASVKSSLADGWQPGMDLPAIMASAIAELVPAMAGVDQLGSEAKEDAKAFSMAWLLAAEDIYALWAKKDVVIPV